LAGRTGASTLCGSCVPLLQQLVSGGFRAPARISRSLLIWSVAAVMAALALWIAAPVPLAEAAADAWRLESLWRNPVYRQITGFVLVGLALAASLLSVRKRVRRLSAAGRFPVWRVAHAAIGLLTLAALAVHTGARTGDNLNLALMTSFSAINVIGGLAGGLTAVEQKLGAAGRYRKAILAAHIAAIWPLPALVAAHVVSVYYF